MVIQNLINEDYQSKEAKMFFLKQRADLVADFIKGLRARRGKVYQQVMAEVTGVEAVITLQSFLLQANLYYKKSSSKRILELLEIGKGYDALSLYFKEDIFSGIASYLKEIKELFELVRE